MGMVRLSDCRNGKRRRRTTGELLGSGFIILDKWSGPTSRDVCGVVKAITGAKKAGHSGTLDHPATGMLPILLDNATKCIPALQGQDKEYVAVVHLHGEADEKAIEKKLAEFIGTIRQKPPLRSAVARHVRERKIYGIELLQKEGRNICIRVRCEAGTYVRLIAHDLGQKLGFGAHLKELRRIGVANFTEKDMVQVQELKEAAEEYKRGNDSELRRIVRPVEDAVEHLKKVVIKNSAVKNVTNGAPLFTSGLCEASSNIRNGDLTAVISQSGELVALGTSTRSILEMRKRGVAVKTDRVIIR